MNNTPVEAREIVAQALESGEYTQGYGCLEREFTTLDVKHCCLGVATREYMKCEEHSITAEIASDTCPSIIEPTSFNGDPSGLLLEVREWLGFADPFGTYTGSSLADVNDAHLPFSEIAELFRNPPEGLLAQ